MRQVAMELSGSALRDLGMQQAQDHAEAVNPGWSERAMAMLVRYLKQMQDTQFQNEDFRVWAEREGLATPPHLRAYGSIMAKARKAGMIRAVGYEAVDNPTAHQAFARVWEKTY